MLDYDGLSTQLFKSFNKCEYNKFTHTWVATAIIGSAAIGAATSAYSANEASKAQTNAANKASDTALAMYSQTRADLAPYRNIGATATGQLTDQLPFLTSPIVMNQANLEKTPGYQFNLTQGTKAAQNSAAARGLGISGAALKGASTFATGLADNTYQNQFSNENTNRTNAYNRLKGLVDTGENAGAQTGVIGTAAANTSANAAIGAGNAQAAAANATGAGVTNFANNIAGYAAYKGLYGGGTAAPAPAIASSYSTPGQSIG